MLVRQGIRMHNRVPSPVNAPSRVRPRQSMISTLFARLFGGPRKLREANERLRREIAAHEATLRELETARRELEQRVARRTKELSLMTARFETALRGARVHVSSQDRELRYTWVYSPHAEGAEAQLLGRTDEEVLAAADRESSVVAVSGVCSRRERPRTARSHSSRRKAVPCSRCTSTRSSVRTEPCTASCVRRRTFRRPDCSRASSAA